jgi:hypothetical protein
MQAANFARPADAPEVLARVEEDELELLLPQAARMQLATTATSTVRSCLFIGSDPF